jgi:hypothetical protein
MTPAMSRFAALTLLLALTACDHTDPYLRTGAWRPNGANEANLRAMVVVPSDVVVAEPAAHADGGRAAAAVARLRRDDVRPLPDSGVAQLVPVSGGAAAPPSAAAPPGTAGNGP